MRLKESLKICMQIHNQFLQPEIQYLHYIHLRNGLFFSVIMLDQDNHWNVCEKIAQNEEKNIFVALKLVRTINDDSHFIKTIELTVIVLCISYTKKKN